jgi:hypothetical protein
MAILALQTARDWGMLFMVGLGIYVFFMFLGVGISSYVTFAKCQKTDSTAHFKQGAIWGIYPFVTYILVRALEVIRIHFDNTYKSFDTSESCKGRAPWLSVGWCLMLASLAGLYGLMDSSIEAVCIPSVDEATQFRQGMLRRQAELAKMQESTPALVEQKQPDTPQPPEQSP